LNEQAAQDLLAARQSPTPLHNNCSGKHAGFLTIALHKGCSLRNYIAPSHPVQRLVTDTLSEMTEVDLERTPCGIDGCGIPVHAMPLRAIAHAMAKLAVPEALPPPRAQAARRIVAATLAEPWLVSGTGRFDARAMAAGGRARFVVKMGAEGVHAAIAPGAGLGIALKIDDGARRAAEVVMAAMLRFVGLLSDEAYGALVAEPVRNNRGELVGKIVPVAGWP
jgi:L-asparaginase II